MEQTCEILEEREQFPLLPTVALRGLSVFPQMLIHFDVLREASIRSIEVAMEEGQKLFLVAQKDVATERPQQGDLCKVGTIVEVRQMLRLPGNGLRVMVEGLSRGLLHRLEQTDPYLAARVETVVEENIPSRSSARTEAMVRCTLGLFEKYRELSGRVSSDVYITVLATREPGVLADYIAQNIALRGEDKQAVLEELRPLRRLERLNQLLQKELKVLELENQLQSKVREHMDDAQRNYFLREQMKVIQDELGEDSDSEIQEYRDKIAQAKLPEQVEEKLLREVGRLEKQPFGSAEGAVLRNYLDICLELPWNRRTKERVKLDAARKILDADHYGLEKVKERVLEFLAVKTMAPQLKGQILCLVGPPGVGKTSIAYSVAKALNRKMARISLGGIRDEAEIRGHRKTYVGAMPGRIINAIRQAGSSNPLLLLDEIDKLGSDYRGDPSAALLEVLDAEQNATFRDHFIEMPFDLSDVLFITTANSMDTIPRPLLDRMEIIEVPSYTDEEKLQIARRHMLPRQMKRHGIKGTALRITDDALREIITGYTKESGVRQMERMLAALCRKAASRLVEGKTRRVSVTGDNLEELLGPRRYHPERLPQTPQVGVVNGLAWTQAGGELLEVEVNVVPGTGKVEPTGNLGDVMRESCHSAVSYIRSRAVQLGVDPDFYQNRDIHIHFPEGAVPKDGPSAGMAITVALVSALTGRPVRRGIAMTGEITLRGRILPIGGLREKTMAAYRNGIRTVLIPAENESDLADIDPTVRQGIHFITIEQADSALAEALEYQERAVPANAPSVRVGEQNRLAVVQGSVQS